MVAGKISKINFDKLDKGDLDVNEDLYTEVSDNVSKEEFEKIKNVALFGMTAKDGDKKIQNLLKREILETIHICYI